jgi:hypothetical protein
MENIPAGFHARLIYYTKNSYEFSEKFEIAPPSQPLEQFSLKNWTKGQ